MLCDDLGARLICMQSWVVVVDGARYKSWKHDGG